MHAFIFRFVVILQRKIAKGNLKVIITNKKKVV